MVGVDPDGFTLRSLLLMANARMRHDWNQTADTLAIIANVNRSPNGRVFTRADFHPMITEKGPRGLRLTSEVVRSRRAMFTK